MEKDFLKKHADTFSIMATILVAVLWINGKLNDLEKDVAQIKTVLVMSKIMPEILAKEDCK